MKIIVFFLIFPLMLLSQPNCNLYKDACKKACEISIQAEQYQIFKLAQDTFDEAIELCPALDYAYKEKSVPYLKNGDFITWKQLIDKAVEINPKINLGYRGWCKYQFLRDYKGAIKDIKRLESLVSYDIGYCQNGNYHLKIVKALAYGGLGQYKKAIGIIEKQLADKKYTPMDYDYLHLGILQLRSKKYNKALKSLVQQLKIKEDLAENYYYLALIYKHKGDLKKYKSNIIKSEKLYDLGHYIKDVYTHPIDRIFQQEIKIRKNDFEN